MRQSLEERFWSKVEIRGPDECWAWLTCTNRNGYGQLGRGGRGKNILAHRVSWALHNGPIPKGVFVLHRCDNPPCCNPKHLFLGTQADNMADRDAKGRVSHTYGEANGRAKLTSDQVAEIRTSKGTQRSVARMFGISKSHVGGIRNNKTRRFDGLPNPKE